MVPMFTCGFVRSNFALLMALQTSLSLSSLTSRSVSMASRAGRPIYLLIWVVKELVKRCGEIYSPRTRLMISDAMLSLTCW
jgi:hypothetical protein